MRIAEAGAAVLFDKGQGLVDRQVLRCASHHPPFFLLGDKPGRDQAAQVEGERRGGHAEMGLQFADREAVVAGAHEQANDLQSGGIAKFSQAAGSELYVHAA